MSGTKNLVDLLAGDHLGTAFRYLNDRAEVPVLEHDGLVLSESWLISEYLDEVFPRIPLMPTAASDRHVARLWNQRLERDIHAASGVLTYAYWHGRCSCSSRRKPLKPCCSSCRTPLCGRGERVCSRVASMRRS